MFERDSFAFANELRWAYSFDPRSGKTSFSRRDPKPLYSHRCFVLASAARQFVFHATFEPSEARLDADGYQVLIRQVLSRSPRLPSPRQRLIAFPGFASLREFSLHHETLLKAECGGAWRSYVLRSHWRMVFPISRAHQKRTAEQLNERIKSKGSAVIHLVCFPKLTINHGMIVFSVNTQAQGVVFGCYDPNEPGKPVELFFDANAGRFELNPNSYWPGGALNVIEIYRNWFM